MNIKKSLLFRFKKFRNTIHKLPFYCKEQLKYIFFKESRLLVAGGGWTKNFGDALNTILVEELSEKKVIQADFIKNVSGRNRYVVVGSILQWVRRPSIIWGAGFISSSSTLSTKNLKILAVRGPLTVKRLKEQNFNCDDVALGDPALLLPLIYNPSKVKKKYKVGLVPHYVDKNNSWIKDVLVNHDNTTIIDIMCGQDWKQFIDQLLSCEIIFSSSLHGLIVAEAYNIPTVWISFSDKVLGEGFKFKDYYASIGVQNPQEYQVNPNTFLEDLIEKASLKQIDIDLLQLLNCCPFITDYKKDLLVEDKKGNQGLLAQ